MDPKVVIKAGGVVFICLGIHFGLGSILPLLIFGAGMVMLFIV